MLSPNFLAGAIIILIGFTIATIGWKIHSTMIALSGFVVGVIIGNRIVVGLGFFTDLVLIGGLSIIMGLLAAIIFVVYEKTAIGVTSGLIGAAISSDFTSTRTLVGWEYGFPMLETKYNYIPIIVAFLISSYVGLRFYRLGYIILSTGIGAILIATGGTVARLWNIDRIGWPMLLSLFLGTIIQLAQEGTKREIILQKQEMKYCSNCKKGHPKEYLVCPDCGTPLSKSTHEKDVTSV
ncbi:MAG: hypothetical protein NTY03_02550 [Candidatus Bathyarchaeota archaeon]|jgi:hypothetical protein|nr:hypothetical protein [Candidatus Bathyarchaeota archaeon]